MAAGMGVVAFVVWLRWQPGGGRAGKAAKNGRRGGKGE